MEHIARLLGVLSRVDARGVRGARLAALLDTGLQVMMDDVLDSVLYRYSFNPNIIKTYYKIPYWKLKKHIFNYTTL